MQNEDLLGIVDNLDIPCIALSQEGLIAAITKSACTLLASTPQALIGQSLFATCLDSEEKIHDLLNQWLRSRNALPGTLTFAGKNGNGIALRCHGVRHNRSYKQAPLILVKCSLKEQATAGFASLNEKIEQLRQQITLRKQAEETLEKLVSGTAAVTGKRFFANLSEHLADALGVRYALISERDTDEPSIARVLAFSRDGKQITGISYETTGTPCAEVYQNGSARYLDHAPHLFTDTINGQPLNIQSYVGISLQNERQESIGHLCVMHDQPMQENDYLFKFMQIFSARAAAELQRQQARNALQKAYDQLEGRVRERTQALNAALARATAATKAKSAFLANMSHEIRTPMNGVLGMLSLLSNTSLNAQQEELLQTANRSAETLLTLINDILDLSKIEADKLELETVDFDLRETLEETISLFSKSTHAKGLELACDMDDSVPLRVNGDPIRLRQIFSNLIGNAIKFTQAGEVFVKARRLDGQDDGIVIQFDVSDTGIGIARQAQQRIFDSFTQADDSTTRHFGGTGLGLHISKQLTQLMGGDISLISEEGVGSTFTFTVCFKPAKEAGEPYTLPIHLGEVQGLVVDDNATNRAVLAHHLENWGIRCDTVSGGTQALAALHTRQAEDAPPYDLVLLDFMMPDMDGLEVLEAISRDDTLKQTRVIMLTSGASSIDRLRADRLGVAAWLAKPVRQSLLYNTMLNVLQPDQAPANADPAPPTAKPLPNTATVTGQILIAEDNPINQKVALGFLRLLGFEADVVDNGARAVEAALAHDYRLIFMDCQMPVQDGYQATRLIRAGTTPRAGVPIIAMTANAMCGDKEKCLACGMDDYIAKPISPDTIKTKLEQWITPVGNNEHGLRNDS